jgi:glucuronokinase
VGLAGSSAIIVATLRCLMEFYDVDIPPEVQPSLALSVERDELKIGAGLQDRVIQA